MGINTSWNEFLAKLALYEGEALSEQIMPEQAILDSLQEECLQLSGNCSAIYKAYLRMCEQAKIVAYKYSDLPSVDSKDGYLSIFDREYRKRFLTKGCTNPFTDEELQRRRTLNFNWQRKHELRVVNDTGKMTTLRDADTNELSKFCVNAIPYQPAHGLGISEYSNNIVCDIEKIAREATFLNPPATRAILPGEIHFNVGQNSHTGSSVPNILHSHQSSGTIDQFKIYQHTNEPIIASSILSSLEIIQVGKKPDAFFLKITSHSVTHPKYLEFCIGLRLKLELTFSTKIIDFLFHVIPTYGGNFITIIVPFAKLIKHVDPELGRKFINPETNEDNISQHVAEHLHLGNASRKWEIAFSNKELITACVNHGKERLEALYDFTSKQGSRDVIEQYIKEHL